MADVLSSSAARESSLRETPEALVRSLDDILERYLNLLDVYQKGHRGLAKNLSSGYISLAQANFSSANRIRYGQDFYDGRMQATTRISVNKAGALGSLKYSVETTRSPEPTDSSEQSTHQASPNETGKEPPDSEASPSEKAASNDPIDPIKWFGMFVPKALRDAQSSFKSVISNVPSLVSIAEEIRQVEAEVESLRGKLKAHEHT